MISSTGNYRINRNLQEQAWHMLASEAGSITASYFCKRRELTLIRAAFEGASPYVAFPDGPPHRLSRNHRKLCCYLQLKKRYNRGRFSKY